MGMPLDSLTATSTLTNRQNIDRNADFSLMDGYSISVIVGAYQLAQYSYIYMM